MYSISGSPVKYSATCLLTSGHVSYAQNQRGNHAPPLALVRAATIMQRSYKPYTHDALHASVTTVLVRYWDS